MDPLVVVWRVTERCNLACPFCAYDRTVQWQRSEIGSIEAARWVQALGNLRQATRRDVLLSWLGGEPFAWPHLRSLSQLARSSGIRVSATTNGLKLTQPEWQRWAAETFAEVTLSIDGPRALHDQFRGEGHHAQTLEILRGLRAWSAGRPEAATRKVNTILLRENIHAFEEMALELAEWGAEQLTFNDLGGLDRPEFYDDHRATVGQMERFIAELPGIQVKSQALGLGILGSPAYLHRLSCTSRGIRLPVDDCHPGQGFWFIDARGRLSPCSFTGDVYALPISEMQTPDDLMRVPERLSSLRDATRHSACSDCKSTQVFSKFRATEVGAR